MSRKYGMIDHDLVGDGVADNSSKIKEGLGKSSGVTCADCNDPLTLGPSGWNCPVCDAESHDDFEKTGSAISPDHYKSHPSGVECIQITEHMDFLLGNAMKYIWRAGLKGDEVEDLKKAKWYLERAIANREGVG